MISLLKQWQVPAIAMTGEINLRGQVTAVGGLREKLSSAARAGFKCVIVPKACRPSIESDVPTALRNALTIQYVSNVAEALKFIFNVDVLNNAQKTRPHL